MIDPSKDPLQVHSGLPPKIQPAPQKPEPEGYFSSFWGALTGTVSTITKVVTSTTADKQEAIENSLITIKNNLKSQDSPKFIELMNLLSDFATRQSDQYTGELSGISGAFIRNVALYAESNLIAKAFISQAFANLATKLNENKGNIKGYDTQPALASLFALLAKNATAHLNRENLEHLSSECHRKAEAIRLLNNGFSAGNANKLNEKLDAYLKTGNEQLLTEMKDFIFYIADQDKIDDYQSRFNSLIETREELKENFNVCADDILSFIFPEGENDPAIQKFLDATLFKKVYSQIQNTLADLFLSEYLSLQKNSSQAAAWKQKLEDNLGKNEVAPFVKAPAMLLGGITKHVIEFKTAPVGVINSALQNITGEPASPLNELSTKNLSNWILESIQAITTTKDKNLEGTLNYGNHLITQLTESLLGKALTLLAADGEKIEKGEMLTVLSDKIAEQVEAETESGSLMPKVTAFIQDLPLPERVIDSLTKTLTGLSTKETEIRAQITKASELYEKSKEQLEKYKGGALTFTLLGNISDVIVNQLTSQDADLMGATGLDEIIESKLDEFLPGLTIDDNLKENFKQNFQIFQEGKGSGTTDLLKKGVHTVLVQAILGTIDESFDKNLSIHDQLLKKLEAAFSNKLKNIDPESKEQLKVALQIQDKISDLNSELAKLQEKQMLSRPVSRDPQLQKAFNEVLVAKTRVKNAESEVKTLKTDLKKILKNLNKSPSENGEWSYDTLRELSRSSNLKEDPRVTILKPDALELASAALDTYTTLKRAEKELSRREDARNSKLIDFVALKTKPDFEKLDVWLKNRITLDRDIKVLNKKIAKLEQEQKPHLALFEELSLDVTSLLGLGNKDKINLPKQILDMAWPTIEDVKKNQMTLLLFRQIAPLWFAIDEIEANKVKLLRNPFLSTLSTAVAKDLLAQLKPEEISELIQEQLHTSKDIKKFLKTELSNLFKTDQISLVTKVTEALLLKFFAVIAEKNPPADGKDTLIVLTEKLLEITRTKLMELRREKSVEQVAAELDDAILGDGELGIKEAIQTLPELLRTPVLNTLKDQIKDNLINLHASLTAPQEVFNDTLGELIDAAVENAIQGSIASIPEVLGAVAGDKQLKMINQVSSAVNSSLENLAVGNYTFANVLLNYGGVSALKGIGAKAMTDIANAENLTGEKAKAAALLTKALAVPVNKAVRACIDYEKNEPDFNERMMTNIIKVAAGHIENINKAEKKGSTTHADFVKAAGKDLHKAVPKKAIDFQDSIAFIANKLNIELNEETKSKLKEALINIVKNETVNGVSITHERLMDKILPIIAPPPLDHTYYIETLTSFGPSKTSLLSSIRKEIEAPTSQRQEEFYGEATKDLLKMLFPGGKQDLTFVPENLRGQTWDLLEKNLFPSVLPALTESLLNQSTFNGIILGVLERTQKGLREGHAEKMKELAGPKKEKKVDSQVEVKKAVENTEFDKAAALLIEQLLARLDLPSSLKDQITTEMLGDALRAQFNGKFLETTLMNALQPPKEKQVEAPILSNEEMESKIRGTATAIANEKASHFIYEWFAEAQQTLNTGIEALNISEPLKKALKAVSKFILLTIIGNIIGFICRPIFRAVVDKYVPENVDALLNPFRRIPTDQFGLEAHAIYNEDLVYKLAEAIRASMEEALNA